MESVSLNKEVLYDRTHMSGIVLFLLLQVDREEVSDAEWRAEIYSVFHASGIVPDVLPHVPLGLVNVNFGTHNCVHMGTVLDSETSAYEPSAVSWPADKEKLYTLVRIALFQSYQLAKIFLFTMEFEATQLEQKPRG